MSIVNMAAGGIVTALPKQPQLDAPASKCPNVVPLNITKSISAAQSANIEEYPDSNHEARITSIAIVSPIAAECPVGAVRTASPVRILEKAANSSIDAASSDRSLN
jgi:hypothetical protein